MDLLSAKYEVEESSMDVTAPSGCINLAPQFSLFSTLVVKPFLF